MAATWIKPIHSSSGKSAANAKLKAKDCPYCMNAIQKKHGESADLIRCLTNIGQVGTMMSYQRQFVILKKISQNRTNYAIIYINTRGCRNVFKQAIIYYPTDDKIMKQICKDIAALHCTAAVKYIDILEFNDKQKEILIENLIEDLSVKRQISV